jgi:hypothetical protein
VVFASKEEKISLVDVNKPDEKTAALDSWPGLVFSLADGQHTIQQLIEYLSGQYNGTPPDELEKTVDSVIERLTKTGAVKLADKPFELPYYLLLPLEKLDYDKTKKLMIDDGLLNN